MASKSSTVANSPQFDQELEALKSVLDAVSPLGDEAREFVFRTAAQRLKLDKILPHGEGSAEAKNVHTAASGDEAIESTNPKEFLRQKKPNSELQRMVCLGFFLTHARNTAHFKTVDLTNLNTEAAGGRFSNASATVRNATNQSHYFAPAGKGGLKQITALGEDYVRALPDQEAAKQVSTSHRPARRKPAKKRSAQRK